MNDIEKLANISHSILKLYRHIIELEENNQDTTIFCDMLARLSQLENNLLEEIIKDSSKFVYLIQFLEKHRKDDYNIYKIFLTNQLDVDDFLICLRIIHKANMILPIIDDFNDFMGENVAIIEENMGDDMVDSMFFELLLTKAFDKTISNLELFYLQEHLENEVVSTSEIDISKVRRYQLLSKYLYPYLENSILTDYVPSIFRMENSSSRQKEIYEKNILQFIMFELNFIINNILCGFENSSYYETNISTLYLIFFSSLEAHLAILDDDAYIKVRDNINHSLDNLMQRKSHDLKPIILIRNQLDERTKKISNTLEKQKYKKETQ